MKERLKMEDLELEKKLQFAHNISKRRDSLTYKRGSWKKCSKSTKICREKSKKRSKGYQGAGRGETLTPWSRDISPVRSGGETPGSAAVAAAAAATSGGWTATPSTTARWTTSSTTPTRRSTSVRRSGIFLGKDQYSY